MLQENYDTVINNNSLIKLPAQRERIPTAGGKSHIHSPAFPITGLFGEGVGKGRSKFSAEAEND